MNTSFKRYSIAEEDTGFLHGISFFREYHNRLYLLYIVHKYSFGCKVTHAGPFFTIGKIFDNEGYCDVLKDFVLLITCCQGEFGLS